MAATTGEPHGGRGHGPLLQTTYCSARDAGAVPTGTPSGPSL